MRKTVVTLWCLLLLNVFAVQVAAAENEVVEKSGTDGSALNGGVISENEDVWKRESLGINIDFGVNSMYAWRGLNVFKAGSQQDHHAMFAPSITWSIFDTGLSIGYWGAYQLRGGNAKEMVDIGYGHEQDLIASYEHSFMDDLLTLNVSFAYYFYPFADEDATGSKVPCSMEPISTMTISKYVDFTMHISYFMGLTEGTEGGSHLYLSPYIGKSLDLGDKYGLDIGLGFGYKMYTGPDAKIGEGDNRFDVTFDVALPIQVTDIFYVVPAVHAGWTNIKRIVVSLDASETVDNEFSDRRATVGDEFYIYAGFNVGADF